MRSCHPGLRRGGPGRERAAVAEGKEDDDSSDEDAANALPILGTSLKPSASEPTPVRPRHEGRGERWGVKGVKGARPMAEAAKLIAPCPEGDAGRPARVTRVRRVASRVCRAARKPPS